MIVVTGLHISESLNVDHFRLFVSKGNLSFVFFVS